MSLDDLYSIDIINTDAEKVVATVNIDAAHPVFEGHFPGSPVLPGVVQLEVMKRVMEKHLDRALSMAEMSTCKFLEVLNPTATPALTIEIKYKQSDLLELTASGTSGATTFFKARASYR
jgi:3-hydroxyacyl-[acyl-carrier-protein] dehydratase